MLAAAANAEDLRKLRYPLLASPKLDGIRLLCHPKLGPVTRSFKPLPNEYLRELLAHDLYKGLDGELMMVDENGKPANFNQIQSAVMSQAGQPQIQYWVFDYFLSPSDPFTERTYDLIHIVEKDTKGIVRVLTHVQVNSPEEVVSLASEWIQEGFEGLILRDPSGVYKSGRSTLKQQGMIKYKEFADAEGIIVGFEELYHNQNPQERSVLGLAERSDKKEGLVPANTLGALVLSTQWGELRVGSGFDLSLRDAIWRDRDKYLGKVVTFKYQTHGMQDLPRFPIFLRFRED